MSHKFSQPWHIYNFQNIYLGAGKKADVYFNYAAILNYCKGDVVLDYSHHTASTSED